MMRIAHASCNKRSKTCRQKLWWKREMAVQHSIFCQFTFFRKLIRESYCYRDFSMSDVCYWDRLAVAGFSDLHISIFKVNIVHFNPFNFATKKLSFK